MQVGSGTLRAFRECSVPVVGPLVAVCWPGEGPEPGAGGRGRGWHGAEHNWERA